MIDYSFIIPHKNCANLLLRCLDSIPQRDDLEVIVIDDNSDDENIREISLISRRNLTVIYDKSSLGAGHARNVGVLRAVGKWLLFADADDFYTPHIIDLLTKYKKIEDVDVVYLKAQIIDEKGEYSVFPRSRYIDDFLEGKFYSEMNVRYGLWTPWTRMVNRFFVLKNKIRFDEIPTGNDMMFSLNCSKYANKISAYKVVVYNYFSPVNRSITEMYRRKIENIHFRIELGIRQNQLYNEVGYLFYDENVTTLRSLGDTDADRIYKREYYRLLKLYKVNIFIEYYHALINKIGYFFHILKK